MPGHCGREPGRPLLYLDGLETGQTFVSETRDQRGEPVQIMLSKLVVPRRAG